MNALVTALRARPTTGFLVGAGISVAAGYPDFRSKDGIYARTAHLQLPYPEALFDITYFRKHPQTFFTAAKGVAREDLGPTHAHSFIKAVQEQGLLEVVITQNIDGLERKAGISAEKLIEPHGSNASSSCIDCGADFPNAEMRKLLHKGEIAYCKHCGGLAKPNVVFFGEPIRMNALEVRRRVEKCDLFIIMGTSLVVQPVASIAEYPDKKAVRVLINRETLPKFRPRENDILLQADCDAVCKEAKDRLGWTTSAS